MTVDDSSVISLQTALRRWAQCVSINKKFFKAAWRILDTDEENETIKLDREAKQNDATLINILKSNADKIFDSSSGSPEDRESLKHKGEASRLSIALSRSNLSDFEMLAEKQKVLYTNQGDLKEGNISLQNLKKIIHQIDSEGRIVHPKDVYSIVTRVTELLKNSSTLVRLQVSDETVLHIVGDLHGQFEDLQMILNTHGFPSQSVAYLFNGDFVDRGPNGCEVLFVLYALKLLYPDRVFLNRGNHEERSLNERFGFEKEVIVKYNIRIFNEIMSSFDALPLAHLIEDKIFVLHGGLSHQKGITLDDFNNIDRFTAFDCTNPTTKYEILADAILWSDPDNTIKGYKKNPRGAGVLFGTEVTKYFMAKNDIDLIVRSHEMVMEGYEHSHFGKIVTVFSASNYCQRSDNFGAVIKVRKNPHKDSPKKLLWTFHTFKTSPEDVKALHQVFSKITSQAYPELQLNIEEDTLNMLRTRIYDKRHDLLSLFTYFDDAALGYVSKKDWVFGMSSCLDLHGFPWYHFLPYLAKTDKNGNVPYMAFCQRYYLELNRDFLDRWSKRVITCVAQQIYDNLHSLENMFDCMDANGDGTITYPEFLNSMRELELGMTDEQLFELARAIQGHDPDDSASGFSYKAFLYTFEPYFNRIAQNEAANRERAERVQITFNPWQTIEHIRRNYELHVDLAEQAFLEIGTDLDESQLTDYLLALCPNSTEEEIAYISIAILSFYGKDTITFKDFEMYLQFDKGVDGKSDWKIELLDRAATVLFRARVQLRRAFAVFDFDGDGVITTEELKLGLQALNVLNGDLVLSDSHIDMLHSFLDKNGDGLIQVEEFLHIFTVIDSETYHQ